MGRKHKKSHHAHPPQGHAAKPTEPQDQAGDKTYGSERQAHAPSQVPPTPTGEQNTCQRPNDKTPRWGILLQVGGFLVLAVYAFFAGAQWFALLDSNKTNRDALQSVQRAFVTFLSDIRVQGDIADPKTMKVILWEFSVQLENSGTTPTRAAVIDGAIYTSEKGLADNFGFPNSTTSPHQLIVLGPKAKTGTGNLTATPDVIKAVQDKKMHLFIYGYCSYRDIFQKPQDPAHITKFCYELQTWGGDPFSGLGQHSTFWISCSQHNCADDDCAKETNTSPP